MTTDTHAIILHGDTVVYGPEPWSAIAFMEALAPFNICAFLPRDVHPIVLSTDDDGAPLVRIVPCSIIDDNPGPCYDRASKPTITIAGDHATAVWDKTPKDIESIRAFYIAADRNAARQMIDAMDIAWYVNRQAMEGIPIPDHIKAERQSIVDAQRAREAWILSADFDAMISLDGIPGWR